MNITNKLFGEKKEWRRMEARAKALPRDYQILYGEIKSYMWKFAAGSGFDVIAVLRDLLELFETGAADGKRALDVTGEDVAAFCDELLRTVKTYTENWRVALNRDVLKKLAREERR